MRILQHKNLYLPAFTIAAVVLLLLGLISISTYRNLNREKNRIQRSVHRQGLTLLSAIEAGARTGMMMHQWQEDTLATLIREIARNDDVAYIYLFDPQGRIVHHSESVDEGKTTTWDFRRLESGWVYSRMNHRSESQRVYEIAKYFSPFPPLPTQSMMMRQNGNMDRGHSGDIIVLGLKMTAYDEARRSDLRHAVVMAAIVLALGSAVFFFVFVIQNYYLVERTLKQTQDYTRQVISSMASGLVSIDQYGAIVSFNEVARDMLGLDAPKGGGVDLKPIFDFDTLGIQEVLDQSRTVFDKEILFRVPDGKTIPMSISVSPICDKKDICKGAVLILRDLTRIKQLEDRIRRSEKLAAVGQLAAGLAHEIRNPLSSIRGFAQFLGHALKDRPKEQGYTEIMVKEIDRINRVVTDLLSFANPKTANIVPTAICELVDHVVRLVDADARAKNVAIRRHIPLEPETVPLDAYQMTQALLNLLLNALKFTDSAGAIDIKVFADNKDNDQLVFQVEDNGAGIPKENLNKIFDPFFTTRETGTGLGLAIVHKIIENHQGDIEAESPPPGKSLGCRMTLRIPMHPNGTKEELLKTEIG
jgi:two-component system, NtrC family, sensor histidine kinase HydH